MTRSWLWLMAAGRVSLTSGTPGLRLMMSWHFLVPCWLASLKPQLRVVARLPLSLSHPSLKSLSLASQVLGSVGLALGLTLSRLPRVTSCWRPPPRRRLLSLVLVEGPAPTLRPRRRISQHLVLARRRRLFRLRLLLAAVRTTAPARRRLALLAPVLGHVLWRPLPRRRLLSHVLV